MPEETPRFELRELAPGVRLHAAREVKWKTTLVVARIAASLAEDATRSALVPFVLAQGTARLPAARDVARALEELYDADLEPDVLRLGDVQVLEWRLEVAHPRYCGADTLGAGLALLADVLHRPALSAEGALRASIVAQEKKNLRAAILGLKDERPEYAVEEAARLLGRDSPSAQYELGSVRELPRVGAADVTARWRALVLGHPFDLLVIGDHAPDEVERAARAAFPLERAAPVVAVANEIVSRTDESVRKIEKISGEQAHLCLGYRAGVEYLGDGYAAALLLHGILGADAQSRLFLGVREKEGLAYEARTTFDRLKGTITAYCGVDPKKAELAEALVEREVARLREEEVPPGELAEAKKYQRERLREVADDAMAAVSAEYARTLTGRRDVTVDELARRIEATTTAEVREAARRLALDCVYLLGP